MSTHRRSRFPQLAALTAITLAVAALSGVPARPAHAATFTVTTLADSGPGSLHQAILDANAAAGADTITFSVSGTITLATALPALTDAAGLVIDGAGQTVTVSGNNLVRPFDLSAGAVAELKQLTISAGSASEGGGIRNAGTLTVTNSTISGSTGSNGFTGGGGIRNTGTLTVATSTISGNSAANNGGGGIYNTGTLTVTNSTISGNYALFTGGGIYQAAGNVTVTNSTISGNAAPADGGGGLARFNGGLTVTNSILAGNTAGLGPECTGGITLTGANIISNTADCTTSGPAPITGNAMLVPLAANGGPTNTHALLPGSPAIDAGPATCAAAPVSGKDQRGVTRPQGSACDLGAFEREAPVVGGKNLTITTGSIDRSWDGGTAQNSYTLLKYNTSTAIATLIPMAGNATSYSDAAATNGVVYCYVLAALNGPTFLGLSDLLCGMAGAESGTVIPQGFSLTLGQSASATMTWSAPAGGADSYLLQRIPLDGSPITNVPLGGGAITSTQAVVAAGTCFQLVAFKGPAFGTSDVLCGVPGVSTLNAGSAGRGARTASQVFDEVEARLRGLGSVWVEELALP